VRYVAGKMSERIQNPAYYPPPTSRRRLWPFRVAGVLALLVQAVGTYAVAFYFSNSVHTSLIWLGVETERGDAIPQLVAGFSYVLLLKPLAVVLLLSGVGVALGRWSGWVMAMLAQCFVLYTCISLYFYEGAMAAIYPIMLYAVVMVLFLNSTGVRMLFPSGVRTVN
jgi:hypothetical protein